MGVNFCAMDKYRKPLTAEQWKTCAKSLKVPMACTPCAHVHAPAKSPAQHPSSQGALGIPVSARVMLAHGSTGGGPEGC